MRHLANVFTFIFFLLFITPSINGQNSDRTNFVNSFEKSKELNKLSLFFESIKELEIAIAIAKENKWEEAYLEASIFMGEMMRRTADHKKGLEVLEALTNSANYLKLHVRKLGRIAALYAEGGENLAVSSKDSLQKYLRIALKISTANNFEIEEAFLCNELGFYKLQNETLEAAKPYLLRSAQLFKKLNDENNYVVVMCHVLEVALRERNFREADRIIVELLGLVKGQKWFGTEQTLYRNISHRYLNVRDSINYYKWVLKEKDAAMKLSSARNNNEMAYLRIQYETEKLQNEARKAALESEEKSIKLNQERLVLKQQQRISSILLLFVFIFLIFSIIIVTQYYKKRRISESLKLSNQNFELLMIESNHRIKNNLQMILSMVDFSTNEANKDESKTLNKISSKIQTIGVLHNYLYLDVHKGAVNVGVYFDEIIRLYLKLNADSLHITKQISPVKINSERIIYFGLILNELLANTIEHNLAEKKNIKICIEKKTSHYSFEYCDYSVHKNEAELGKGSLLLEKLVQRIKGTNFQLDKKSGTYKFNFKDVL